MIERVIGLRRRHTRLHDAMTALEETRQVQIVNVPTDREPHYYQKYAHMLAARWGVQIHTRSLKVKAGNTILILSPKT